MVNRKSPKVSARMACMLVASLMTASLARGAVADTRPQLLLGILIEGLDGDRLQQLKDYFRPDGFRRLMDQGFTIERLEYGPGTDAASAATMLMTGAAPVVNGVAGLKAYDITKKVEYPIFAPSSRGDYSNFTFTPAPILVSTLTDEVKVSSDGVGQVLAITPQAWQAVIMAGHSGNSGCYLDDNNGKWVSPAYYKETPTILAKRNTLMPLASRLDTIVWKPSIPSDSFPGLVAYQRQFPFKYTFSRKNENRFRDFMTSAPGNRETSQAATDFVEALSLGKRGVLDALGLYFNVTPYPYGREADVEMETLDAYLRLDADLANLFKALDRAGGMDKTVVFVAGIPKENSAPRVSDSYRIPTGQFSPQRAISLLNLYLMAIHGNGDYVTGYHHGYFYLNRDLIRDRDLNLQNIRIEAADFLARMSGVSETFTIDDVRAGRAGDNGEKLRRNTAVSHAGDVLVHINPGWEITDESAEASAKLKKSTTTRQGTVIRPALTQAPAFILAPSVEPQTLSTPVDARVVAPTVARLLRIRAPNASTLAPLKL